MPALVSWDNPGPAADDNGATTSREDPPARGQDGQPERLTLEALIVYPTPTKEQAYLEKISEVARKVLVGADYFCFVGYSLPPADRHVPKMFPIDTLKRAKVVVVNTAGNKDWLQRNYIEAFPGVALEFAVEQFQEWILSV